MQSWWWCFAHSIFYSFFVNFIYIKQTGFCSRCFWGLRICEEKIQMSGCCKLWKKSDLILDDEQQRTTNMINNLRPIQVIYGPISAKRPVIPEWTIIMLCLLVAKPCICVILLTITIQFLIIQRIYITHILQLRYFLSLLSLTIFIPRKIGFIVLFRFFFVVFITSKK